MRLITAGAWTLLVDQGRQRSRGFGLPVSGAADATALALGNALVGNAPTTPALEICLSGPTLVADCSLACILFGAPFELGTPCRRLIAGRSFTLESGEPLSIGGTPEGMRAYFCVQGGLEGPVTLESASSLHRLSAGAELGCTSARTNTRFLADAPGWVEGPECLRILPGRQADWFPPNSLAGQSFQVTPASNRMGLRLFGEPLPVTGREMISEPVCSGSVQVTRDGQCIVLGVDGQTIGGYPKIAQVIGADLDKLGQLRPGARTRFHPVTLDEAELLLRSKLREKEKWLLRVRAAGC